MPLSNKPTEPLKHIAIIMDGNGRWAVKKGVPKILGHRRGKNTLKRIIAHCVKINLQTLSVFAFSTENINRPKEEINGLFKLFLLALKSEVTELKKNNIQLKLIGDLTIFPKEIQNEAKKATQTLNNCTGLTLVVAVNYGGQWDIAQASKKIGVLVQEKKLKPEDIVQETLETNLSLATQPPVDILIRTSGECRISNFLLWECAYAELFFTKTLWPDFKVDEFSQIISQYQLRDRRFGQ